MKFGITPLDGEYLVKIFNGNKGLIDFSDFRFSDLILDVINSGFRHCEISLDLFQILPLEINKEEEKRIINIQKQYDFTFSAHFPIYSVELSSPNKFIREASVQSCIDSYKWSYLPFAEDSTWSYQNFLWRLSGQNGVGIYIPTAL